MQTSPGSCWVCHAQRSRDEANTNNVNFFFNLKKQAKKKRQKTNKISNDKKKNRENRKKPRYAFSRNAVTRCAFYNRFWRLLQNESHSKTVSICMKMNLQLPTKIRIDTEAKGNSEMAYYYRLMPRLPEYPIDGIDNR